jgi:hypothetical protein
MSQNDARRLDFRAVTVAALSSVVIALVVVSAVFATAFIDDRRSCERQTIVRVALHDYANAAALARERSARHEQARDPAQARIDLAAAVQFRANARKVPALNCRTFPAGK